MQLGQIYSRTNHIHDPTKKTKQLLKKQQQLPSNTAGEKKNATGTKQYNSMYNIM